MTNQHATVGFVGLGMMGEPMAANIVRAGFPLKVHDADPERTEGVAAEIGAEAAVSNADLQECTVVVLMLPTSAIVRAVLLDDQGDLRIPFRAGTVIVDMSSSDPNDTVETAKALESHGLQMVDAPVSGARERAVTGTLSIMMGANSDEAAEVATPVVEAMSQKIFRTGAVGTGHAMKALNNFVAAAAYTAASEALISGERFGLDPAVMVDIFNASTGQSFVTQHVLREHIVERAFSSGFSLPLMTKDVRIARELQRAVNHEAPVCEAVVSALGDALDDLGAVDHTRAFEYWEAR